MRGGVVATEGAGGMEFRDSWDECMVPDRKNRKNMLLPGFPLNPFEFDWGLDACETRLNLEFLPVTAVRSTFSDLN